ncbi:titin-like isoform X2 [Patiria miniata]|uniref:Uncharacterized protein n=1 Tax=Patiria miniata TaxID=46514 RepID=A0A913Z0Q2_PATMI|nr:titin-like isoform X2 [Patiria miniata]
MDTVTLTETHNIPDSNSQAHTDHHLKPATDSSKPTDLQHKQNTKSNTHTEKLNHFETNRGIHTDPHQKVHSEPTDQRDHHFQTVKDADKHTDSVQKSNRESKPSKDPTVETVTDTNKQPDTQHKVERVPKPKTDPHMQDIAKQPDPHYKEETKATPQADSKVETVTDTDKQPDTHHKVERVPKPKTDPHMQDIAKQPDPHFKEETKAKPQADSKVETVTDTDKQPDTHHKVERVSKPKTDPHMQDIAKQPDPHFKGETKAKPQVDSKVKTVTDTDKRTDTHFRVDGGATPQTDPHTTVANKQGDTTHHKDSETTPHTNPGTKTVPNRQTDTLPRVDSGTKPHTETRSQKMTNTDRHKETHNVDSAATPHTIQNTQPVKGTSEHADADHKIKSAATPLTDPHANIVTDTNKHAPTPHRGNPNTDPQSPTVTNTDRHMNTHPKADPSAKPHVDPVVTPETDPHKNKHSDAYHQAESGVTPHEDPQVKQVPNAQQHNEIHHKVVDETKPASTDTNVHRNLDSAVKDNSQRQSSVDPEDAHDVGDVSETHIYSLNSPQTLSDSSTKSISSTKSNTSENTIVQSDSKHHMESHGVPVPVHSNTLSSNTNTPSGIVTASDKPDIPLSSKVEPSVEASFSNPKDRTKVVTTPETGRIIQDTRLTEADKVGDDPKEVPPTDLDAITSQAANEKLTSKAQPPTESPKITPKSEDFTNPKTQSETETVDNSRQHLKQNPEAVFEEARISNTEALKQIQPDDFKKVSVGTPDSSIEPTKIQQNRPEDTKAETQTVRSIPDNTASETGKSVEDLEEKPSSGSIKYNSGAAVNKPASGEESLAKAPETVLSVDSIEQGTQASNTVQHSKVSEPDISTLPAHSEQVRTDSDSSSDRYTLKITPLPETSSSNKKPHIEQHITSETLGQNTIPGDDSDSENVVGGSRQSKPDQPKTESFVSDVAQDKHVSRSVGGTESSVTSSEPRHNLPDDKVSDSGKPEEHIEQVPHDKPQPKAVSDSKTHADSPSSTFPRHESQDNEEELSDEMKALLAYKIKPKSKRLRVVHDVVNDEEDFLGGIFSAREHQMKRSDDTTEDDKSDEESRKRSEATHRKGDKTDEEGNDLDRAEKVQPLGDLNYSPRKIEIDWMLFEQQRITASIPDKEKERVLGRKRRERRIETELEVREHGDQMRGDYGEISVEEKEEEKGDQSKEEKEVQSDKNEYGRMMLSNYKSPGKSPEDDILSKEMRGDLQQTDSEGESVLTADAGSSSPPRWDQFSKGIDDEDLTSEDLVGSTGRTVTKSKPKAVIGKRKGSNEESEDRNQGQTEQQQPPSSEHTKSDGDLHEIDKNPETTHEESEQQSSKERKNEQDANQDIQVIDGTTLHASDLEPTPSSQETAPTIMPTPTPPPTQLQDREPDPTSSTPGASLNPTRSTGQADPNRNQEQAGENWRLVQPGQGNILQHSDIADQHQKFLQEAENYMKSRKNTKDAPSMTDVVKGIMRKGVMSNEKEKQKATGDNNTADKEDEDEDAEKTNEPVDQAKAENPAAKGDIVLPSAPDLNPEKVKEFFERMIELPHFKNDHDAALAELNKYLESQDRRIGLMKDDYQFKLREQLEAEKQEQSDDETQEGNQESGDTISDADTLEQDHFESGREMLKEEASSDDVLQDGESDQKEIPNKDDADPVKVLQAEEGPVGAGSEDDFKEEPEIRVESPGQVVSDPAEFLQQDGEPVEGLDGHLEEPELKVETPVEDANDPAKLLRQDGDPTSDGEGDNFKEEPKVEVEPPVTEHYDPANLLRQDGGPTDESVDELAIRHIREEEERKVKEIQEKEDNNPQVAKPEGEEKEPEIQDDRELNWEPVLSYQEIFKQRGQDEASKGEGTDHDSEELPREPNLNTKPNLGVLDQEQGEFEVAEEPRTEIDFDAVPEEAGQDKYPEKKVLDISHKGPSGVESKETKDEAIGLGNREDNHKSEGTNPESEQFDVNNNEFPPQESSRTVQFDPDIKELLNDFDLMDSTGSDENGIQDIDHVSHETTTEPSVSHDALEPPSPIDPNLERIHNLEDTAPTPVEQPAASTPPPPMASNQEDSQPAINVDQQGHKPSSAGMVFEGGNSNVHPEIEVAVPGDEDVREVPNRFNRRVPLGLEDDETLSDTMNATYDDWSTAGFNMMKPLLLAVNTSLQPLVQMLPDDVQVALHGADFLGIPWPIVIIVELISCAVFSFLLCVCICSCRNPKAFNASMLDEIEALHGQKADILDTLDMTTSQFQSQNRQFYELKQSIDKTSQEKNDMMQSCTDLKDKERKLQKELKTKQSIVTQQESKLKSTQEQVDLYEEQVSTANQTIAALQQQVLDLKDSLHFSSNNMSALQHKVQSLSEQNQLLTSAKEQLTEEVTGWNERVSEMNEQVELLHNEKKDLEESVTFKDNEIEVLKDCLLQLKGLQSTEEDDTEVDNEARVQQLMDVTRVSAKLSLVESEKNEVEAKYEEEVKGRRELEAKIGSLQQDVDTAQSNYKQAKSSLSEAQTKLDVMTEYFKNKEVDLQRKLGREEALRLQSDSKLETADGKAASAEVEVTNYRTQIRDLKEELEKAERNFRNQVAAHEKKAHDSWISARSAERELQEAKREAANLRHRLTELEGRRAKTETAPLYKPSPSGREGSPQPLKQGTGAPSRNSLLADTPSPPHLDPGRPLSPRRPSYPADHPSSPPLDGNMDPYRRTSRSGRDSGPHPPFPDDRPPPPPDMRRDMDFPPMGRAPPHGRHSRGPPMPDMDYDPHDMRDMSPGPPPDFRFDPHGPPPPDMDFDPHGPPPFGGPPPPLRHPFAPRDFPPHPDDFDRRGPPMDDRDFGPPPMDDRDFRGYGPPPPGMDFGPRGPPPPGPMHGPGPYPNDMGPPPMDRPPPPMGPHGPSPGPRNPGIRPGSRGPFPPPAGAPPPGGFPPSGPSFGTPSGSHRTSTPLEGTPVTPQTRPSSRPMQGP